jgi:hypothetical protein
MQAEAWSHYCLAQPADDDPLMPRRSSHVLFPVSLVAEVCAILQANGARFSTYADLVPDQPATFSEAFYAREFLNWQVGRDSVTARMLWRLLRSIAFRVTGRLLVPPAARRRDARPVVLLQHDADAYPEATLRLMCKEREWGVVSSAYFFREPAPHDTDAIPYAVDLDGLRALEACGFEVGYHQNAFERAGYQLATARELLSEDVAHFRRYFRLRSFVPHGGRPGANGEINAHMPPDVALNGLLWAYCGGGLRVDETWSDGYVEYRDQGRALEDPRRVAARTTRHRRVRFLMHPQYYGESLRPDWSSFSISECGWWRALWGL